MHAPQSAVLSARIASSEQALGVTPCVHSTPLSSARPRCGPGSAFIVPNPATGLLLAVVAKQSLRGYSVFGAMREYPNRDRQWPMANGLDGDEDRGDHGRRREKEQAVGNVLGDGRPGPFLPPCR